MAKNVLHSTGESWKALAEKGTWKPSTAIQTLVQRMNEIWPFSDARGIFDDGCGTGTIMLYIIDNYGKEIPESARIIAGDFSEHMLESLRKAKQARSVLHGDIFDRLEVRNMDAHDLSGISTNSMSHVTGGMVFNLLPDARQALRESNRVLRSNGIIALTVGKSSQHIDALNDGMEKVRPGTHLALLSGVWATEEGVKGELEAVGFVEVETHLVESKIDYTSHEQFAEVLLLMPVMKNAADGFSDEERVQLRQAVIHNLKAKNPDEPGTMQGVTIVALGRKPA